MDSVIEVKAPRNLKSGGQANNRLPLYPMSVQSVMGVLWPPLTKNLSILWTERNKTYFYHTIRRETQNSPAKVFTKSAGLPTKPCPLRFFTIWPNTARKFSSCRSDKGYSYTAEKWQLCITWAEQDMNTLKKNLFYTILLLPYGLLENRRAMTKSTHPLLLTGILEKTSSPIFPMLSQAADLTRLLLSGEMFEL